VIEQYRPDAVEGQQGTHFYKGRIGRFRESYKESEQILLQEKFGPYLRKMGYSI